MTPRGPIARAPSGFCNLSTEPAPAAPATHSPADGRPDTRTVHTIGRRGRDTPAARPPLAVAATAAGPRRCPRPRPPAEPVRPPRACTRRARRKPSPAGRTERRPRQPPVPGPSPAGAPSPTPPHLPGRWGGAGCRTGAPPPCSQDSPFPRPRPRRPWI